MHVLVMTLHREVKVDLRAFVGEGIKNPFAFTFFMSGSPHGCCLLLLAHSMYVLNDVRSRTFGGIL